MLFVTLGSQKFQFNRLLKAVDKLIEKGIIKEKVFAQIGYSDYKPQHYEYQAFLDHDEFEAKISSADMILTHGGVGVIFGSVAKGKRVVAIPRQAKYGEHVDDHQKDTISKFSEMNLIAGCMDLKELGKTIKKAKKTDFQPYYGNNKAITDDIVSYIDSI